MATVPLSGTNVRLLSDVPFTNDYKNTRWFDTVTEQTNYFVSKPTVYTHSQHNFQRIEGKTFIAVNKSIDELWGTCYLMFQNTQYNSKWFYAFVTKLEYVQKGTTHVYFQIDVFQTWKFQMRFKPSYVVREHCPLWNTDGSPVINTLDEGLHYGSEYETVSIEKYVPYKDNYFLVVASKQVMHVGDENSGKITPVLNGAPQPLSYYVIPFKLDGTKPIVKMMGLPLEIATFSEALKELYSNESAVNNIVSIYVTEYIGKDITYDEATDTFTFPEANFEHRSIQDGGNINVLYVKTISSYNKDFKSFGNKYDDYTPVVESKLLMYPYTVLVLDDFKGNRVEFKNESIDSQNLAITVRGSMGTSNKVAYSIEQYLAPSLSGTDLQTLSLEHSLINSNPNDVPIITDMLSAYLQGNRNSIENQRASIQFNGLMNGIGAGVGTVASAVTRNPLGTIASGTDMIQGAGNTVLQLQGMNAKMKDIDNVPPQITKMGSNTAFDYGNGYNGLYIIKKQIKNEYRRKLTHFFNMFGYKVNEIKVPNFHTRLYWNYVQTESCNITGNFNNEDLQELKKVFDSGITLWHTDDVGNYELENEVI